MFVLEQHTFSVMPTKKRKVSSSDRKAKFLRVNKFRPVMRACGNCVRRVISCETSTTSNSKKCSAYSKSGIKCDLVISEE